MERVHTTFRDVAASLRMSSFVQDEPPRARVWAPAWSLSATGSDSTTSTGGVIELPLFTLAPRWFEYYAYISVGLPPQFVRVALDTTSSDLSILGFGESGHETYDHAHSKTYQANNTLVRTALPGTDAVALGVLSQDRITLNPITARLENQSFTELLARPETATYFQDTLADGWLGLGRSRVQQAFPVASVVDRLFHSGVIGAPVVGIHLDPLATGLLTFGGINTHRFEGDVHYVHVTPLPSDSAMNADATSFWSFRLDSVLVNGKPVTTTAADTFDEGGSAILDAVLPVICGPRHVVDVINAALGQDGALRVPCDGSHDGATHMNVTFVIGGTAFTLARADLVVAARNSPGCVSLLLPTSDTPTLRADWSIGAPFLTAFYTALDYGDATQPTRPRIGFARSKRYTPPGFSAYDSLWLVLLVLVVVLIMRSIGRATIVRRRSSTTAPKAA